MEAGRPVLRLLESSMQEVTMVWSKVIAMKNGGKWVVLEYIMEVELIGFVNVLKGRL